MQYGGKILFRKATLQLLPKNHYGLVGPNGAGKSTLFKIITGELSPDSGEIAIPTHQTIGTLKQDHYIYDSYPIIEVVLMGRERLWAALQRKEALFAKPEFTEADCEVLGECEKIIEELHGYSAESEAAQILDGLGLPSHVHSKPMHLLSGGHKLRVLLAQLLFSSPDVLLLDEPTNHLDIFSIHWLEGYLNSFTGTILLSSHDRHFLNAVCSHIVDLDYGTIATYKGNYDDFERIKEEAATLKGAQLDKQEKKISDMREFAERFGAKASKAKQAQSKLKMVEKLESSMESMNLQPTSRRYPKVSFGICRPSGVVALKVEKIVKNYGEKQVLHGVSFEIERGEKVAFVGANGIGKSTLLEILTGHQQATSGTFTWGFEAHNAYFPQDHSREVSTQTKDSLNLLDWLNQFESQATREILQKVLARALFSGDDVKKSVSILSGGETARLILAKMMLVKHNVLIFDEPTNHLDMEATENLIEALEEYPGTVLFVSHNRYFVERLASRVIEMTPEGLHDFKCTYGEYVAKRDLDHLDVTKALRISSEERSKSSVESGKATHVDSKKTQRQKDQLQRKVEEAEKKCERLERSIEEVNKKLSDPSFYTKQSKLDQDAVLGEKLRLDQELAMALQDWEHASQNLVDGP